MNSLKPIRNHAWEKAQPSATRSSFAHGNRPGLLCSYRAIVLLAALACFVWLAPALAQDCVYYSDYLREVGSTQDRGAWAVAVVGDYAYVGRPDPNEFEIVDIRDPADPRVVGGIGVGDGVSGIAVAGSYAYVAARNAGFWVIDITGTTPVYVGYLDTWGSATHVAIAGNYAYIAAGAAGLLVIDITDPTSPFMVGNVDTSDEARGVVVTGNLAYVADGLAGLYEIDISNPLAPFINRTVNTPGRANRVAIDGDYAYVADQDSGLQVVDLADQQLPIVSSVPFAGAYDITISDGHAFVAAGLLKVIDISDPTSPTVVGGSGRSSYGIAFQGNYVYVADAAGLEVFDASNPTSPLIGMAPSGGDAGIAVAGRYAYVGMGESGWLNVIDVDDPTSPIIAATIPTPHWPEGIAVAGDYAYLAMPYGPEGFAIVDISTPTSPLIVGGVDTPATAHKVAVSGNYAYVADDYGGLQVIDVSDPYNPWVVHTVPVPNGHDVVVAGDYAYVAAGNSVVVVDISSPMQADVVGTVPMGDGINSMAVAGSYAYAGDVNSNRLSVIDIADPTSPVIVGESFVWVPWQIAIDGTMAYIAGAGLSVVDISNPTSPRFMGRNVHPNAGTRYGIAVSNGCVFATTYTGVPGPARDLVIWPTQCQVTTAAPAAAAPAVRNLSLLTVEPNPANRAVRLAFDLPRQTEAQLRIYDVAGRCVRRLVDSAMPAGPNTVTWDRRDDNGRVVAGGVYVARLTWPDGSASRRVVMAR